MTTSATVLTLRVTLDDVQPAVWRRLKVRGDCTLPSLHAAVQDAMGWEDRHLHMFFTGPDVRDAQQRYEMQMSLDEYDDGSGVVEDGVRVDALLSRVGDNIGYEYDFGDSWRHRLVVEDVEPDDGSELPLCVGGRRACPPEDIGGPPGFADTLRAVADPYDPEHEHLVGWLGRFDREHFDAAEANARIASRRASEALALRVDTDFPTLARLFTRVPLTYHQPLSEVVGRIEADDTEVDPLVARAAMDKLTWMLTAIGDGGIGLTAAGYLPPKIVAGMRDEIDWGYRWIGNSTREIDNVEPFYLRKAVSALGLARVLKGRLILTRVGKRVASDPVALWHHVAEKAPLGREDYEQVAGRLLLACVAGSCTEQETNVVMWDSMELLGWQVPGGSRSSMRSLARPTVDLLELVGAVTPRYSRGDGAKPWAVPFAVHSLMH